MEKHYSTKIFLAERGENYHGVEVYCNHRARKFCRCESHPLKGTPMTGAMSGYYEPEWDERTAWEELVNHVGFGHRPEGMSDTDWEEAKKIARLTQEKIDATLAWVEESEEAL